MSVHIPYDLTWGGKIPASYPAAPEPVEPQYEPVVYTFWALDPSLPKIVVTGTKTTYDGTAETQDVYDDNQGIDTLVASINVNAMWAMRADGVDHANE